MKTSYQCLLQETLRELEIVLGSIEDAKIDSLIDSLRSASCVFVTGKGRSGLQMQGFAMRLMHAGLQSYFVDDITTPGIQAGDLLLIGSGSGRTASLVGYAQKVKEIGARLALITADPTSTIARHADVLLHLPAPTPKSDEKQSVTSIHPMGTLFEQALGLLCDLAILRLMQELSLDEGEMFARHANLE